jgi:hypothetical protein
MEVYMNYNYNPYQNYGMYQQQPMMQPQQNNNGMPFNDVKFATIEEAKAYIMLPNTKVMFMDRDNSVFYIKSADSLGKSMIEAFKYVRIEDNPSASVSHENFVKIEDLKDYLKDFVTRDELNNVFKKDEE